MGLLQSWSNFTTYTDADGYYRPIWQFPDGRVMIQKFESFRTEKELERYFDKLASDYDGTEKLTYTEDSDEELLKTVIVYIRTHPAMTLTQLTNYLSTLTWYKQHLIKSFMFKLAIKLSEKYGVVLEDYTENQIFQKLKNWIVNANLNVLKRVCFGYLIQI